MEKPTLTIFIATYNREAYLPISINSVLNQTYQDFSLVILDNASQDRTTEVVAPFLKDQRVSYIRHEQNLGSCGNVNYAVTHCETDYFMIFHDDDIMLPHLVETQMKEMQSHSGYAIISANAFMIDDQGVCKNQAIFDLGTERRLFSGSEYLQHFLRYGSCVVCPMVLYRTAFMKEHALTFSLDAGPAGDQYMWFEIERCGGTVCVLNEVLLHYRKYQKQESTMFRLPMEYQLLNHLLKGEHYRSVIQRSLKTQFLLFYKLYILDFNEADKNLPAMCRQFRLSAFLQLCAKALSKIRVIVKSFLKGIRS